MLYLLTIWSFILFAFINANQINQNNNSVDEHILLEKAKSLITNATTYHWLARYKNNDSGDILISKNYFLESISLLESSNTEEAKILLNKARQGLIDTEFRYENSFDNINNEYPLFDIITNRTRPLEFFDDPEVIAINYATDDALAVIPMPIGKNDFQYDAIILSNPPKLHLEDEVRVKLNMEPQFFPRPVEDILSQISFEEYSKLYDDIFSKDVLNKIANGWNKDKLIIANIVENDLVNDVTYLGLYLYEWDVKSNQVVRSVYADGFAEDRLAFNSFIIQNFIFLIIILLIVSFFAKYIFFFKHEKNIRPVYLLTAVYSFLLNIFLMNFIVESLVFFAPESMSLAVLPYNRLWISFFIISCSILPFIFSYFLFVMTPYIKERLNDSETLHSLIFGIILAQLFFFKYFHSIEFNHLIFDLNNYVLILIYLFYIIWVSICLSNFFVQAKKSYLFSVLGLVLIQIISLYSLMINQILIFYPILILIFSILLVYKENILLFFKNSSSEKTNTVIQKSEEQYKTLLQKSLNHPPMFIDPSDKGDFVSKKVLFFSEKFNLKTKPNAIFIEGHQGVGKTRLAKEIAQKLIAAFHSEFGVEGHILYGDCDELNKSGTGVPYEPFSQALHQILGAGRFEPPNKKANKIKEGINSTGLNQVLDIGGLGVLNLLLGTEDTEVKSATTNEMSLIVYQTLIGLSKESPVVLIIDDLHWMDDITFNLFELLLKKITKTECENIFLIFTSRYKENNKNKLAAVDLIKGLSKDQLLNCLEINHDHFSYKERFDELLNRSLNFDKNSTSKYLQFINDYEIDNILVVLQSIKSLIDLDFIDYYQNKVQLNKKYSPKKLKPPKDIADIITNQLKELSDSQLQIIKFASFIGHEFRASILTEALKLDRLQVLYDLEVLEQKDIIVDIRAQDDVYEFKSNAIINVVRYMSKISDGGDLEIPQIVREYHFRVAQSIINKAKSENRSIDDLNNQLLFNLAKRSWAAGDRMPKEAIEFNTAALKKSFDQFRYEESIQFGKNILEMREKFKDKTSVEKVIEIKLIICQSLIIVGSKPEEIDKIIEECKSLADRSLSLADESLWKLLILNVEGDALVHDHSGYFNIQRDEISEQIKSIINNKKIESNFSLFYSKLTLLRLDDDNESSKKYELLVQLLKSVENKDNIDEEVTRNPISGFKNDSITDYMILRSEILEEIIHLSYILNDNDLTLKYIEECKVLKQNEKINDQEGLSFVYLHEGDCKLKLNRLDEAIICYNNSKTISKKIGNEKLEALSNIGLSNICIQKNEYNEGLNFLIESLKLNIFDDFDIQYKVYTGIIKIAYKTNSKDLFNEYIKDINNLFEIDKNKAYLYNDLKGSVEKFNH